MEPKMICKGVYQVAEKGAPTLNIQGKEYSRIMDFFYIDVPADELDFDQVSMLCKARIKEPRCFEGANKKVKSLFNSFLKAHRSKNILEVGAGTNPILTQEETKEHSITYMTSDADNYQGISFYFDANTNLPNKIFDVVIALFVLHFKFYQHQIDEIYKHMKIDGIFLANVYNREDDSRNELKSDFEKAGFNVQLIKDPESYCKNHYYLMATKGIGIIDKNRKKLFPLDQ